jgi:hypothetical protein
MEAKKTGKTADSTAQVVTITASSQGEQGGQTSQDILLMEPLNTRHAI